MTLVVERSGNFVFSPPQPAETTYSLQDQAHGMHEVAEKTEATGRAVIHSLRVGRPDNKKGEGINHTTRLLLPEPGLNFVVLARRVEVVFGQDYPVAGEERRQPLPRGTFSVVLEDQREGIIDEGVVLLAPAGAPDYRISGGRRDISGTDFNSGVYADSTTLTKEDRSPGLIVREMELRREAIQSLEIKLNPHPGHSDIIGKAFRAAAQYTGYMKALLSQEGNNRVAGEMGDFAGPFGQRVTNLLDFAAFPPSK